MLEVHGIQGVTMKPLSTLRCDDMPTEANDCTSGYQTGPLCQLR